MVRNFLPVLSEVEGNNIQYHGAQTYNAGNNNGKWKVMLLPGAGGSPTFSATGMPVSGDLIGNSQLLHVYDHADWAVGQTWTLAANVSSTDTAEHVFGFAGAGGFLMLLIPAGPFEGEVYVTDQVGQVSPTAFEYRGNAKPRNPRHFDGVGGGRKRV